MSNPKTRSREFQKLAGQIDVAGHQEAIAQIDADLVRIEATITQARDRISLLSELLKDDRPRNAQELASKLLNGADPQEAVATLPNNDDLKAEREQLNAALRELAHTRRDKELERSSAISSARRDLSSALSPLCEHYRNEARDAASRLEESFAALSTLGRCGERDDAMTSTLREAVTAARGDRGPLNRAQLPLVPDEVLSALSYAQTLGLPMRIALPKTVQL